MMAEIKDSVDAVFEALVKGLPASPAGEPSSGWEMKLPSGEIAVRSQLEQAAHPLIELGQDAVPDLIRWAGAENGALRYVAVYALQEITEVRPFVGHFDNDDKEGHRQEAIAEWRRWWLQRSGK